MKKSEKYIVSVEVLKYPYCGKSVESEEFLSERICCYTIRVRKKVIRKVKRFVVYGDFIIRLTNGVVPSQAIGLPILPTPTPIMRSIHSVNSLDKQAIIGKVVQASSNEFDFTEKQMNQLYDLAVKCGNGSMSRKELITELRGGGIEDWVAAFGVIIYIIFISLRC